MSLIAKSDMIHMPAGLSNSSRVDGICSSRGDGIGSCVGDGIGGCVGSHGDSAECSRIPREKKSPRRRRRILKDFRHFLQIRFRSRVRYRVRYRVRNSVWLQLTTAINHEQIKECTGGRKSRFGHSKKLSRFSDAEKSGKDRNGRRR